MRKLILLPSVYTTYVDRERIFGREKCELLMSGFFIYGTSLYNTSKWCLLSVEIGDAEGEVLLKMIVNLFITVRGFSFAKSVMEMYKQENKKCTQKSKSLRRKLPSLNCSSYLFVVKFIIANILFLSQTCKQTTSRCKQTTSIKKFNV